MISVNDVTMNFGARMLFDKVNVTFNAGERYGLTGPNGSADSPVQLFGRGDRDDLQPPGVLIPETFWRLLVPSSASACSWCASACIASCNPSPPEGLRLLVGRRGLRDRLGPLFQ